MLKKSRVPRMYYFVALILLAIVVTLTALPIFMPQARIIYDPAILSIVYALLSLAVSIIIFGVLGDSEALIKSTTENGFSIQIAGSAAGFVIFFYLFTKGLSPFSELTIYVYKAKDQLVGEGDGKIEVTLAGRVRRSDNVSNGKVTFAYLPKVEDRRLLVGGDGWQSVSISPSNCQTTDGLILSSCDLIEVLVEKSKPCLNTVSLIIVDSTPIDTTLDVELKRFVERVQKTLPNTAVNLQFSDALLAESLHRQKFIVERKDDTNKGVCAHLSAVEGLFNRAQNSNAVSIATSCNSIFVLKSSEALPRGYEKCTQ